MVFGSVCSGIEAASLAWLPLGWKASFYSEIHPFPRAVLKHYYPETKLYGDFRKIQLGDHEPIDVLVGGTPCQSFSIAGLRQGLDAATGNLALEYIKLAARLRPRWLVWENVPGLLSLDAGRAFGTFLGGLVECGYSVCWRILDAQFAGVPQRRRRIFVIGYLGTDWRPSAAVLFDESCLCGNPPPRRETRQEVAETLGARTAGGSGFGTDFECAGDSRGQDAVVAINAGYWRESDIAQPVTAGHMNGHEGTLCFGGNNRSGPIDVATACHAKGGTGHSDFETETFVTHSLRAEGFDASEDGTGRGTPILAFDLRGREGGAMPDISNDTASVRASNGGSSRSYIAFNARQDPDVYEDRTGPLDSDGSSHAIAFSQNQRNEVRLENGDGKTMGPLTADGGKPGQGYPVIAFQSTQSGMQVNDDVHAALDANNGSRRHNGVIASGVRRLTPTECERLMGLPDGYTKVPYRGKPARDGPRYKAIGNSFAVPIISWIGKRIQMVEDILK